MATPHNPKFPTLAEVEDGIKALEAENWPIYDGSTPAQAFVDMIHEKLSRHFKNQFMFISQPANSSTPFFKLYRVRPWHDIKNASIISEHSYPPPAFCKSLRANIAHHPVFYASDGAGTALLETIKSTKADPKQIFCVSQWTMSNTTDLIISPFLFGEMGNRNPWKKVAETMIEGGKLDKIFQTELSEDQMRGAKRLLQFYSSCFTNDTKYSISSIIGHSHLYMNSHYHTDIFIYPSIETRHETCNFAIHPNVVHDRMKLEALLMLTVNRFEESTGFMEVNCIAQGFVDNNRIKFKKGFTEKELARVTQSFGLIDSPSTS